MENISTAENSKLIVAMDKLTKERAREIITVLNWFWETVALKFNDLLSDIWFEWLSKLVEWIDISVMIDCKWYDIDNTLINNFNKLVSNTQLLNKTLFLTVHASNGKRALSRLVQLRKKLIEEWVINWNKAKILSVTALTTFNDETSNSVFWNNSIHSVLKLAKIALDAWVDWIVCSPQEAVILRSVFRDYNFEIVTPWVRFKWWDKHDQERVLQPADAINNWVSHIVMWRPILWDDGKGNDTYIKSQVERFLVETSWIKFDSESISWDFEFERLLYTWSWSDLLKFIWAFYMRPEWWKYCRLASWLLSDAYINIWATERNYLVMDRASRDIWENLIERWIKADVVVWAQMWSVRLSLMLARELWIEESIYTEKMWENDKEMWLKRHDIDFAWKRIILSEDIITKWSTLEKMIKLVKDWGWEVVAITCVWNRYWKDEFLWIPLISCYNPPEFNLFWDEQTPTEQKWNYPKLPDWSLVSEKPKNDWNELVLSMR